MTLRHESERLASLNKNSLSNRAIIIKSDAVTEEILEKTAHLNYFTNQLGYRSIILKFQNNMDILYYEATIVSDVGYARIGMATKYAEIEGPIGMDRSGCSFGSKNGYLFINGKRVKFGERFSKNDIVSCVCVKNNLEKRIVFFVNGMIVGNRSIVLPPGKYHPAFSLFGGCILCLNSGPFFAFKDTVINKLSELDEKY